MSLEFDFNLQNIFMKLSVQAGWFFNNLPALNLSPKINVENEIPLIGALCKEGHQTMVNYINIWKCGFAVNLLCCNTDIFQKLLPGPDLSWIETEKGPKETTRSTEQDKKEGKGGSMPWNERQILYMEERLIN